MSGGRIGSPADDTTGVIHSDVDIEFHGFLRADYGFGTRYPKVLGRDQLGITKTALEPRFHHDNFTFVAVLGGTILSDDPAAPGTSLSDSSFKDLFVVIEDVCDSETDLISQPDRTEAALSQGLHQGVGPQLCSRLFLDGLALSHGSTAADDRVVAAQARREAADT